FLQLLQLIESSDKKKQEQLLALVKSEDTHWEAELRKKILTYERIMSWNKDVLSEVLTRLQPLTLCNALQGETKEYIESTLVCLQPITKRKYMGMIDEASPNPGEKFSCKMKIVTEVRGFIQQGLVKLEKSDPEMAISENIEEQIDAKTSSIEGTQVTSHGDEHGKSDLDIAKRKLQLMSAELNQVKIENQILKDKLTQIRKIA
ncbi:MAG: hypothetical protein ACOYOK_16030, partial [Pseudobdellovibrionaceae bacterium]